VAIITQLKLQTKNKNRVNVYLDDAYFCALELETVVKHSLKEQIEIKTEDLEKIILENEFSLAYLKALNYISKVMKTTEQVKKYLSEKGFINIVIEKVILKLTEYKYLDDENFARIYVNEKSSSNGKLKLQQDLYNKGIKKEIIDKVIKELPSQEQKIAILVEKYMRNKEATIKEIQKLYAYLMRRGFTYNEIKPFLKGWEE